MSRSEAFAGVRVGRFTADLIRLAEIENERASVEAELERRMRIARESCQSRLDQLNAAREKLTRKIREEALEAVAAGADPKTLGEGVSHRVTHRPHYDRDKVLFWALDSEFEEELVNPQTLKVTVFERKLRNHEFSEDDIRSMRAMGVELGAEKRCSVAIRVDRRKLLYLRDELDRRGIDAATGEILGENGREGAR